MSQSTERLSEIRRKIDDIDIDIQSQLAERSKLIIAAQSAKGLDKVKGESTAMRANREAQMFRALVARHAGHYPLITIERIWRELIASSTQMEARFQVLLSGSDQIDLCEIGRYYFGFSTPLAYARDAHSLLETVAARNNVIGIIVENNDGDDTDWWVHLAELAEADTKPVRIIARLPFLIDNDHDAVWRKPAFIIAHADFAPSGDDATLIAVSGETGSEDADIRAAAGFPEGRILARAVKDDRRFLLMEIPGFLPETDIKTESPITMRWLGGYGVPIWQKNI